jgi:hypothetical protein
MTDDKMRPAPNDQREPAKPKQSGQDTQQRQIDPPDASAQDAPHPPRGRKPLFRN